MSISVRCDCGAKLKAKDSLAGKKVKCPKCKQPLVVAPSATSDAGTSDLPAAGSGAGDRLGPPAGGELGGALDPFASDATGNGFDLGDFSESELGAGVASPLGAPVKLPSPAAKPVSSPAKKSSPAKNNRTVLIAAIGGGGGLLLLLMVGGLVAWMVFSGGSEVAVNSPDGGNTGSAPVLPANAPIQSPANAPIQSPANPLGQSPANPPIQLATNPPSQPNNGTYGQTPASLPSQPNKGTPGELNPGAAGQNYPGLSSVGAQPVAGEVSGAGRPAPAPEEVWIVLSNLDAEPTGGGYEVSVDWKLVQGRPQPGKKYPIYVNMKVVGGFVGSVETIDVDLTGQQGTAVGKVSANDANGPRVVTHVVMGDEEGEGFRMLVSGELKIGKGPTAAQPPAR